MLRRRQCWSDGAAQADYHNAIPTASHSFATSPVCHTRTLSLNGLDCFPSSVPLFQKDRPQGTSSSSDILARVNQRTRYPLLPCQPPESRSPTPPGLPSFSTGEAERLRLMPLTHLERLTRFLQERLARRDTLEQQDQTSQAVLTPRQQDTICTNDIRPEEPAEMLRRILGTTGPVTVPVRPIQRSRSGLPKGVIRSAYPGALVQAEDRTHVRGRFGARASGHGVGQRNLELHPLARRDNSSEVGAIVREIDKACAGHGNNDPSEPASQREPRSHLAHENLSPRAASTTAMAIAESLTAIQAIEREQRALKALRDSRRENARLKAALKALQNVSAAGVRAGDCVRTGPDSSDYCTVRLVQQTDERECRRMENINDTHPPLRGDSEQTNDGIGPTDIAREQPAIVEPLLYSSYSSYSYTPNSSDNSPPHSAGRARRILPTMESMIEHQVQEEHRHATEEALQRCQRSEKNNCEHC